VENKHKPKIDKKNMSVEKQAEISDTSDDHRWIDGRRFHKFESAAYEIPNDIEE
jgi:hypothetical protein